MQFYEHPGQVTVATPILRYLQEHDFKEASYGNDVWPCWCRELEDGTQLYCYFVGQLKEGEDEPTSPSIVQTLGFSWEDNWWRDIPINCDWQQNVLEMLREIDNVIADKEDLA